MKSVSLFIFTVSAVFSLAAEAEKATYRVTIQSNWNEAEHLALPSSAHFSPIVAVTHNTEYTLLPIGAKATQGIEDVAEMGRTSVLESEINQSEAVGSLVITENQFVMSSPIQTFEVEVSADHPYLSLVSMIAPSPDWMVGVNALKMYGPESGFVEAVSARGLYALDGGTESGDFGGNFSISNPAEESRQLISVLSGEGFNSPFAKLSIERIH